MLQSNSKYVKEELELYLKLKSLIVKRVNQSGDHWPVTDDKAVQLLETRANVR